MQLAFDFGLEPIYVQSNPKPSLVKISKERKIITEFFRLRLINYNSLCNYPDPTLKKHHGREGKKALRCLAKELCLTEFNVDYNPSGMIDAGYLTLIGLWEEDKGIYIQISSHNIKELDFLYRSVKHLKDWRGGPNYYLAEEIFLINYDLAIEKLLSLRRWN